MAVNNTPICLDLDLQNLRVFGAGELFKGQSTLRTLRRLQDYVLMAFAHLGFNGTTVPDSAALLSALTARCCLGATLAGPALLALGGEEALLQVADLSQC